MNNRQSWNLILIFLILLMAGMLLGNLVFLAMSLVPFFVFLGGRVIDPPRYTKVETNEIPRRVWLGQDIEITREVTVESGIGTVNLFQEIPPEFSLVEGNNIKTHWKKWGRETVVLSCRVRCHKRGAYTIPRLKWVIHHPLGMIASQGTAGDSYELTVLPQLMSPRQIKSLPSLAVAPFPMSDVARMGIASTDFREIRKYTIGDPVKNINWKATMRQVISPATVPMVNEYEREGRKAVLIFLDASPAMLLGSPVENLLEYAIEATGNLLYYFIDRGYRVGLAVSGTPNLFFYPDSGQRQITKIIPELVHINVKKQPTRFQDTIDTFKSHILNYAPLSIVVSSLDAGNGEILTPAFRQLRSYYQRRRRLPVMLINITARDVIPLNLRYHSQLSKLMELQTNPAETLLHATGIKVVKWNPRQETFRAVLARQVKKR